MRIKEWFLWHFPELHTIITDNQTYVKVIKLLGSRDSLCDLETEEEMTEELKKLIKDDELVQQIVDAAKNSMGQDMMDLDKVIYIYIYIYIEHHRAFCTEPRIFD